MSIEKKKEKAVAFLEELRDVCNKHGFLLGGCGCCNSPYAQEQKGELNLEYSFSVGRPTLLDGSLREERLYIDDININVKRQKKN